MATLTFMYPLYSFDFVCFDKILTIRTEPAYWFNFIVRQDRELGKNCSENRLSMQ